MREPERVRLRRARGVSEIGADVVIWSEPAVPVRQAREVQALLLGEVGLERAGDR